MDISIPFSQLNLEFLLCVKYCGKCHGIRSRLSKYISLLKELPLFVVNEIDKSVREAELSSE